MRIRLLSACVAIAVVLGTQPLHARDAILAATPAAASAPATLPAPDSAFHAWEIADAEARRIAAQWAAGEPVGVPWTRVVLERYIKHKQMPTRGARGLALVHVAMHDAFLQARTDDVDAALAVSMAAARTLGFLFPTEERAFERIAFALAASRSGAPRDALSAPVQSALRLGAAHGDRVVEHAQHDGAQYGWNGARLQWYGEGRVYGPGTWQPTPPYFYFPPDEPFAPGWRTWKLARADQFRPVPPLFGSAAYLEDLREVVEIQRTLSPAQLAIAKFWVDGHGSVTPPGHWNQIAIDEALRAKLDDATAIALFADLNMAMADTFVAVWDCKYHYWTARPITAAKLALGAKLQPAILTPPFPSYVSGHAAFSGAAGEILSHYLPARAGELRGLAEQAAMSRLLGGIHFRHDNEDGLRLGREVAGVVLRETRPSPRGAP